jgi:molecular chaperone GrpE
MSEDIKNGDIQGDKEVMVEDTGSDTKEEEANKVKQELEEMRDKYIRLYAEFDNYKRKVQKDREELIKYSNESLLEDLLPVLDNIEMALKHANTPSTDNIEALRQGVENTLREMQRTLEKYGVVPIEAEGKEFDPACHHAMSQVERDDIQDNMVVEEFRKGYMLREKVLRPSLVVVSKKTNVQIKED